MSMAAAANRLFPIPASPRNTTPGVVNVPDWARAQLFCSLASSRSRPTNGPRARDASARSSATRKWLINSSTPFTGAGGRASTSNAFRISGSTASETTTAFGGARLDTRAARLAANPYTSSCVVSRYTSPRCTPTRTLISSAEAAVGLFAEPGYVPGDFQPGLHRPKDVVLVCLGVTEHHQQPVTCFEPMCALISTRDPQHLLAVAAHQQPVRFRLELGGQHRRIHQIGEQNRQPPNLTGIGRGGEQILRVEIAVVDRQHLPGQRRRDRTITTVDRRNRTIEQFIDRHAR